MGEALYLGKNSVIITAQASYGENGFKFLPQSLAVEANLARAYGYSVKPLPFPTVLDGLVAMHIQKYGACFDADPTAYLQIGKGMLKRAFAEPAFMARFYLNGKMPEDENGIGYTADLAPVSNDDQFEFWLYTDPSGACLDFYTYFDKTTIVVQEGEAFSLQLFGFMTMGEDYAKMGYVSPKESIPQPIYSEKYEVSLHLVNQDGSLGKRLGYITNKDGRFEMPSLKPGSYLLTAAGHKKKRSLYRLILPCCRIEVLPVSEKKEQKI